MKNPAAGGGRWVEVPPERFVSWIVTFAERHGGADGVAASRTVTPAGDEETVTFSATDGAAAECHSPFPSAAAGTPGVREAAEATAADAGAERPVAVLLAPPGASL